MNQERQEIKKFIKNALIFCLPLTLFFGISLFLLLISGELTPLDKMVRHQRKHQSSTIGLAYSDPLRYIKLQSVLARKPEITMLGSSHTAYFRSIFFKSPPIFYNASVGGAYPQDFRIFLNRLPKENQPKILIVGIDSEWFDEVCNWQDYSSLDNQYSVEFNASNPFKVWQYGYTKIYKDYFNGKFSLQDVYKLSKKSDRFGLNAIVNKSGYRWDGTPIDAKEIAKRRNETNEEFTERTVANFFSEHTERSKKCPKKFNQTTSEIKKFLAQSKSRGVYVIGYITPHANGVYQKILESEKNFSHISKIAPSLKPIFERFGFKLYNFVNIGSAGIPDQEMLDQVHASEKASLRILLLMQKNDPKLRAYLNLPYLKEKLGKASDNLFVFENDEF